MPEATLETFGLQEAEPGRLEQRRAELVKIMTTDYSGFDDSKLPIEILTELSVITGALRRRTAKPPKVAPKRASKTKVMTVDDLSKIF